MINNQYNSRKSLNKQYFNNTLNSKSDKMCKSKNNPVQEKQSQNAQISRVETPIESLDSIINFFTNEGNVRYKHFTDEALFKLLCDYTYELEDIRVITYEKRLLTPTLGCVNIWIDGFKNPIVIYTKYYPFEEIKVILPKS